MRHIFHFAFPILSLAIFVQADVSHVAYSRYRSQRGQPLRLQRLESSPIPYPAAGHRPGREFNLPREQPFFPLSHKQGNRQKIESGFDDFSEAQGSQRPQLLYGPPEPRFLPKNRPENSNDFNNLAELQPNVFEEHSHFSEGNRQSQNDKNGFNNLRESQHQPNSLYEAPNNQDMQSGFDVLSHHEQRAQYNSNNPSDRLRQLLVARLQQAERSQQQAESQHLYATPFQQQVQSNSQGKPQTSRFIARKPERLTDNREEREEESAETSVEIETNTKVASKKNAKQIALTTLTPTLAATGLYYPAAAFSYVQPFSASYVQPVTAAYTVGSPFLPQQYTLGAAAPPQLQAW